MIAVVTQDQKQVEGEDLRLFEVGMAYDNLIVEGAESAEDAALAAYVHFGARKNFSGDELAAYINVYDENGEPLYSLPIRQWRDIGREYVRALEHFCIGCAVEHGLEEGTELWRQHVDSVRKHHITALGQVA